MWYNDSTCVWSKAFSSSVTPTTFQVLNSVMWPGAMVWTEQVFKKSCHHRVFYWTFHSRSLRAAERTLAPGRLSVCCVNPLIFACFVFFASFLQSQGFENLVPFKLSTGGKMWLGSTKWRAEEDDTMRTLVWTKVANEVKIKLHGALVAHWALCVWCLSWIRAKLAKNSFTKKFQDRWKWRHSGSPVLPLSLFPFFP